MDKGVGMSFDHLEQLLPTLPERDEEQNAKDQAVPVVRQQS
jgi:hypothetical protein